MKRFNLNELKVQSFVTSVEKENVDTVKGGTARISRFQVICDSTPENCQGATENGCQTANGCGGTFPASCRPSGFQIICDTSINCF